MTFLVPYTSITIQKSMVRLSRICYLNSFKSQVLAMPSTVSSYTNVSQSTDVCVYTYTYTYIYIYIYIHIHTHSILYVCMITFVVPIGVVGIVIPSPW